MAIRSAKSISNLRDIASLLAAKDTKRTKEYSEVARRIPRANRSLDATLGQDKSSQANFEAAQTPTSQTQNSPHPFAYAALQARLEAEARVERQLSRNSWTDRDDSDDDSDSTREVSPENLEMLHKFQLQRRSKAYLSAMLAGEEDIPQAAIELVG